MKLKPYIMLKRTYEVPDAADGLRILVDRMWPRGVFRRNAKIDFWAKHVAPSNDLRKWYGHDPKKWEDFKKNYFNELDENAESVSELLDRICRRQTTTFVYSSKEKELNNAAALKEYIEQKTECQK